RYGRAGGGAAARRSRPAPPWPAPCGGSICVASPAGPPSTCVASAAGPPSTWVRSTPPPPCGPGWTEPPPATESIRCVAAYGAGPGAAPGCPIRLPPGAVGGWTRVGSSAGGMRRVGSSGTRRLLGGGRVRLLFAREPTRWGDCPVELASSANMSDPCIGGEPTRRRRPQELRRKRMSSDTVPRWPRIDAVVREDGTGEVTIDGTYHPISTGSLEEARVEVLRRVTENAARVGRPVRASATGPEGLWNLIVHPDGTVVPEEDEVAPASAPTPQASPTDPHPAAPTAPPPASPGIPPATDTQPPGPLFESPVFEDVPAEPDPEDTVRRVPSPGPAPATDAGPQPDAGEAPSSPGVPPSADPLPRTGL